MGAMTGTEVVLEALRQALGGEVHRWGRVCPWCGRETELWYIAQCAECRAWAWRAQARCVHRSSYTRVAGMAVEYCPGCNREGVRHKGRRLYRADGWRCRRGHTGVVEVRRYGPVLVAYCAAWDNGPCQERRGLTPPPWRERHGVRAGEWAWGRGTWLACEAVALLEARGEPATPRAVAAVLGWPRSRAVAALTRGLRRRRPYLTREVVPRIPYGWDTVYSLTDVGRQFIAWARGMEGGPPPELAPHYEAGGEGEA